MEERYFLKYDNLKNLELDQEIKKSNLYFDPVIYDFKLKPVRVYLSTIFQQSFSLDISEESISQIYSLFNSTIVPNVLYLYFYFYIVYENGITFVDKDMFNYLTGELYYEKESYLLNLLESKVDPDMLTYIEIYRENEISLRVDSIEYFKFLFQKVLEYLIYDTYLLEYINSEINMYSKINGCLIRLSLLKFLLRDVFILYENIKKETEEEYKDEKEISILYVENKMNYMLIDFLSKNFKDSVFSDLESLYNIVNDDRFYNNIKEYYLYWK